MKQRSNYAEVKLLKVGEPLTDNADGNTEPSTLDSSKEACVETRRGVCIKCGSLISQTKYKSAKYCSSKCRDAFKSHQWRIKKGLIKAPFTGSGGNQWGENNHQYTTGKTSYKRNTFNYKDKKCERCGSNTHILVHHKDENRENNSLENLEVLCKKCHQHHHCKRDKFGKYTKV